MVIFHFNAENVAFNEIMPEITANAAGDVLGSGYCGSELKWWVDNLGTLTISGNDNMTSAPWKQKYSNVIRKVIIDKDVKNIYQSAFSGLKYLTEVHFEDGTIGEIRQDNRCISQRSSENSDMKENSSLTGAVFCMLA